METRFLQEKLAQLRLEHHDLDVAINALAAKTGHDQLQLARMKKRKLHLKDQIATMENQLLPDIIA